MKSQDGWGLRSYGQWMRMAMMKTLSRLTALHACAQPLFLLEHRDPEKGLRTENIHL